MKFNSIESNVSIKFFIQSNHTDIDYIVDTNICIYYLLGETRLRGSAIKKVKNYYQEVAWGALSSILDHVILWWSREALATHHSHGAQHLKDWLRQFIQGNESKKKFSYISKKTFFSRLSNKLRKKNILLYIYFKILVPPTVRSALQTLCDALGYHTTITAWDQMFRLAYTSAFECRSKPSSMEVDILSGNF